jgi:hypothetical protein
MKDIERERLLIRRYLLGELDENDQEQLEKRVITNPDYKEEVLITEEELLEEFVNGTLSLRELESFTRMYSSSPAQRRKVKIAQALNRYASEQSPVVQPMAPKRRAKSLIELFSTKNRFHQLSLAALTIILVIGGSILVYWLISHHSSADYDALLRLNQFGSELLQPDSSVVAVALPPLLFRGTGEPRNISITKQSRTVQLWLPNPSGGAYSFRAILKRSDGSEVFTLEDLRARQIDQHSVLVLQIPAEMLTPQGYQLEIFEKRADGTFETPSTYPLNVTETQ